MAILPIFPGLTVIGAVAPQVRELAVTFNTEGLDALTMIPEINYAWADQGTRVTEAVFEGKISIDLTALQGFAPFTGTREFKKRDLSAVAVNVNPWDRNLEWDLRFDAAGNPTLRGLYSSSGIASSYVSHARNLKAELVASVIMGGTPSQALALTLPQPGFANGLPLYSSAATTGAHFANPLDPNSRRFDNYHPGAGQFNTQSFSASLTDMIARPSPVSRTATLGARVTDVIGPSHMLIPFYLVAAQMLNLQTTVSGGTNLAAAASNAFNLETMAKAQAMIGQTIAGNGATPWRFWIAPHLDSDPYITAATAAYATAHGGATMPLNLLPHLWITVSQSMPAAKYIELAAPTKEFVPKLTIFGDGSPNAVMTRKVQIIGDMDAGAAAGLYMFTDRYEQT